MITNITFYPNGLQNAGFAAATQPAISAETFSSSGGETTGGAYDLVDNKRGTVMTFDSDGENQELHITQTATVNISATFVIIDNHNLETARSIVTIESNGGSVTPEAYSGLLEADLDEDALSDDHIQVGADGLTLIKFSTETDNVWEILIDVADAAYAADVTIGELSIGKYFTPAHAPDQPTEISQYNGVNVQTSLGGQKSSRAYYGERKAWQLKWSYLTESDKASFLEVWQTTQGPRFPFYIDLGESTAPLLHYVRFVGGSLNIKKLAASAYDISVTIESEV